ncbi:MAG TPA: alpha-amylase family glycosyl hydrolase [Pyrinomonadaceae bacterium]|jgi:glycosidase
MRSTFAGTLLGIMLCAQLSVHTEARAVRSFAPPTVAAAAPSVLKVEPPSWWAGHSINPVRLLVRGTNLHGARVASTRTEIRPEAILVNPSGTYLFVSLHINANAQPGDYPLILETTEGRTSIPFSLNPPLDAATNFQGMTRDDVIYLIMTDRFSNGDTANDAPAGSTKETSDRSNPRSYHGGDFRGIINHLPYLKDLGVTAIWLTPWYDNWNGFYRCEKPWCPYTYYHGYHALDYYAVEDHFGDLGTLRELVQKAHSLGLKVIQDQVANHVGSQHAWTTDPPLADWFHGTLQSHLKNPFRGDLLLSPHAAEDERRPTLDGWFSDDLPDMSQEEPEVARYLIQNSLWWTGMTGLDAIRQDTIQYMPRSFIRELSKALHRQYPRMWMVGEVFDRDPAQTAFFIGGREGWDGIDTELDSVFDFPLWQASLDVFSHRKPARTLRDVLKYDALYSDASRLTTMLSNHDVDRTVSLEGMTLEGAALHTAFMLMVRGTPQLYYGDEIALKGGSDPDNRRDFPGGFPGDARSAFTKAGRTPEEERIYTAVRDWLRLRREHSAIRHGSLIDLAYDEDLYAFARSDASETVIIAINRAATPAQLSIKARLLNLADGARLSPLLGAQGNRPFVNGAATVSVPPRTALAYRVLSR